MFNNYVLVNGAKVLNSTNYYPNKKMWSILDPDNKFIDVWNRYSHVSINLTNDDMNVILNQHDYITIEMNSDNVCDLGIDYILSADSTLEKFKTKSFKIDSIYANQNMYIYKIDCMG